MNNEINVQEAYPEANPKENNLISLVSALLNGEVLQKVHPIGEIEYFWCEKHKGYHSFYIQGFGSALGTAKNRLFDVIDNSEQWTIKLNNEQEVQECDARNDATSNADGNQNKTSRSEDRSSTSNQFK